MNFLPSFHHSLLSPVFRLSYHYIIFPVFHFCGGATQFTAAATAAATAANAETAAAGAAATADDAAAGSTYAATAGESGEFDAGTEPCAGTAATGILAYAATTGKWLNKL